MLDASELSTSGCTLKAPRPSLERRMIHGWQVAGAGSDSGMGNNPALLLYSTTLLQFESVADV